MIAKSFVNVKKKTENEHMTPNPMNTSKVWAIENALLEIYSLLIHRIKGLGWSLRDFWEADTWTTSKLYLMELDLIDAEERELKGKSPDKTKYNSPEMNDLYDEMFPYEE